MSDMRDLQERIGTINGKSGFNQAESIPEEYRDLYWERKLLLVVSEIVEAQDELRHGKDITEEYLSYPPTPASLAVEFTSGQEATEAYRARTLGKPEGAPSEMADAVIRVLGICYEAGIDLQAVIENKLEYNETREFMHGKKF